MQAEALSLSQLAEDQKEKISDLFGVEVPNPPTKLFQVAEDLIATDLFTAEPFYLPRLRMSESFKIDGWKSVDSWLYDRIRDGLINKDATLLPGQWVLLDTIKRPNTTRRKDSIEDSDQYSHLSSDDDEPMYPDRPGFKEVLAKLRDRGEIEIPNNYQSIPKDSRFGLSFEEIEEHVTNAMAGIIGVDKNIFSIPSYVAFNFIGNLSLPDLGEANTSEWVNIKKNNKHLVGGNRDNGGLSRVSDYIGIGRAHVIGFRLQVSFPDPDGKAK